MSTVKTLEWEDISSDGVPHHLFEATPIRSFGRYQIHASKKRDGKFLLDVNGAIFNAPFDSVHDAKEAANKDWRNRIEEALT